ESELDEETLLDIVSGDMDALDGLTSRDLKLAVGEDVEELEEEISTEDTTTSAIEETVTEDMSDVEEEVEEEELEEGPDGVEALKNLLAALNDKNVAASMKGMKISINITLGDN
ncbi:MAG: DNA topoisomerase IV, partial [Campylobacterota bacterium]|nr:DNA topoisomerase IV [Campylobacterota bacterium]